MKLEVGEYYLNVGGEIVQIEDVLNSVENIYTDGSVINYLENGRVDGDWREFDLIAHIPKELHQYLIQTIKDYHTDLDFKATVDNVYGVK